MSLKPNALTTLALCKQHLGIKVDDVSQDVRLELFINAASERIEKYTDRKLVNQGTITELQHGRRDNILILREYPILAIAELRIDSSHVFTDASTLIPSTDYSIGDDKNVIIYHNNIFPSGYNNIQIKYTAGYNTPPSDLELACLWFVEWFYLHRSRGDMGRTTSSKGDESVGVLDKMPKMIQEMIDEYVRMDMPLLNSPVRNV